MEEIIPLQPLRIPQGWVIGYNQLCELDPDPAMERDRALAYFKQDLLQFTYPRFDRLVDIGWYPNGDMLDGEFRLVVYQRDFLGELLHEYDTRSRSALVAELEQVLHDPGRYPLPSRPTV